MSRMTRKTVAAVAAATTVLVAAFGAGMAFANHVSNHVEMTGSGFVGRKITTDTSYFSAQGTTWRRVPNSGIAVTVPSGTSRLLTAQFSGTGSCVYGATGYRCALRIMASNGSSKVELNPKAGAAGYVGYVIDGGTSESVGMVRSRRFGAGTWTLWVEAHTNYPDNYINLNGWHFMVDVMT